MISPRAQSITVSTCRMEQRSSTETLNEVGDAAFIQTLNELERCRRRCNTHNARTFITLAASVYQRMAGNCLYEQNVLIEIIKATKPLL